MWHLDNSRFSIYKTLNEVIILCDFYFEINTSVTSSEAPIKDNENQWKYWGKVQNQNHKIYNIKAHGKTHLRLMPHICVSEEGLISSGNGLSPVRHQAVAWTNYGLLWIGLLGTSLCEIGILIPLFSFKYIWKCRLSKWRPFCPGGIFGPSQQYDLLSRYCGVVDNRAGG